MSVLKLTALSAILTLLITIYLYPKLLQFEFELLKSWRKTIQTILSNTLSYYSSTTHSVPITSTFGLKISLILISFYTGQGILKVFKIKSNSAKLRSSTIKSKSLNNFTNILPIPFHFIEIPILLSLILFGVTLIPSSLISHHVTFLKGFAPVLAVLELFCFMTVVLSAGRAWTPRVIESHDLLKALVIMGCFISFFASSFVFYLIYTNFRLSTLISSLLSSILTLVSVQIITCCQLDHATITDPALIFPYISYNLALIVLRGGLNSFLLKTDNDPQIYPKDPQKFLKLTKFLVISTTNSSLVKQIFKTIFSPILVFHLLLQLTLLTLVENEENEDDEEENFIKSLCRYFITNLWPLFGKSFLVIIYTISWLEQCHPEIILFPTSASASEETSYRWYLDTAGFWRWMIVFGSLVWYGKHLIFDGNCRIDSDKDKSFWNQFQYLKD